MSGMVNFGSGGKETEISSTADNSNIAASGGSSVTRLEGKARIGTTDVRLGKGSTLILGGNGNAPTLGEAFAPPAAPIAAATQAPGDKTPLLLGLAMIGLVVLFLLRK